MGTRQPEKHADLLQSLEEYREANGLNISQLAERLSFTRPYVSRVLAGEKTPGVSFRHAARALLDNTKAHPTPTSFNRMRQGVTAFQEESNAYEPDQHGRPRIPLHPKTLEKCQALMDDMECLTPEEVVSKLVNVKFQEVFPGKDKPFKESAIESGTAAQVPIHHEDVDDADEVYDVDMTKPTKK